MKIDDFIGLPYKPGARGPDCYDCFGLLLAVSENIYGHIIKDINYILELEDGMTLDSIFNLEYKTVIQQLKDRIVPNTNIPKESDLVIFYDNFGNGVHCGVMLGRNDFIHCDRHGVRVSRLSSYFRNKWSVFSWQQ